MTEYQRGYKDCHSGYARYLMELHGQARRSSLKDPDTIELILGSIIEIVKKQNGNGGKTEFQKGYGDAAESILGRIDKILEKFSGSPDPAGAYYCIYDSLRIFAEQARSDLKRVTADPSKKKGKKVKK